MNETLHTKFGTATINNKGYYRITSRKEGNYGKLLHRLVFEDYHDCKLDKNDIIHHIDGDKINNHHANLICISKKAHMTLHKRGGCLSEKHKKKIGEANTCKTRSEETRQKMSYARKGKNNHMWNKKHTEDSKIKMSKSKNTTGYLNVSKLKNKNYKNGFTWRYCYYDENGNRKSITSVDIKKLEKKIKDKGLPWMKIDEE